MHRSKASEKDLFSTSCQQVMFMQFLGRRAPVHVVVVLEDKHLNNECPPLLLSLSFFAEHDIT